ncbi:hypothetical protein B0H16DRAFT_1311684 [Mycena metata]|uniref:BTB domain-containing protein n=1 Tax=Mycena metata TaxID=1033252 RepID=A0AAD7JDK7_9AGAR|nr:hypothetical protein B0H16DRAFT_1311684 [Mycena metata]
MSATSEQNSDTPLKDWEDSSAVPLSESDASCKPVEELWFSDGTLVLVAGTSMFRVYGGLLAKHSPVFGHMLESPQSDDAELIDGTPVVHLADNQDDLKYFLSALIDYEFFGAFPATTTFDTIAGIIRLSKKYEVGSLRKRALIHLSSAFPMTREEFPASPSWTLPPTQWIRVILLAREMSLDWILPTAFYQLLENPTPSQLVDGINIDGVQFELAPQDRLRAIEQSIVICRRASAEIVYSLWGPAHMVGCYHYNTKQRASSCSTGRLESRKVVETRMKENVFPMNLWTAEYFTAMDVCNGCRYKMQPAHQEAVDVFWAGLPERFGLPGVGCPETDEGRLYGLDHRYSFSFF